LRYKLAEKPKVDMIEKLFVYGTLGPGRPNEHILGNIGGSWEKASVAGILHDEGWGSALGYPGITLDKDGDKVEGFLFSSDTISEHWSYLDDFEGEAYERVLTKVELQNKTEVDAYIYTLKQSTIS
jgi:gamma-glutamylcyclotransferase (GGCT)/AIG2-like uncharacterized protein YtfP